jgi:hypothetical protein
MREAIMIDLTIPHSKYCDCQECLDMEQEIYGDE